MGKVPEYNLRAINKYNSKFDRIAVNLPIGTKERIKKLTGKSCNAYISSVVLADLERLENAGKESITEEQREPLKADKKEMGKAEFDELNEMIKRLQKENEEGKLSVSYRENVENKEQQEESTEE